MKVKMDERRLHVMSLLGICLLTVCAFLPTFWNRFQMEWDDQWMVMNPLTVLYLDWHSLLRIFSTSFNGQWAPLNQLLYTVLYNMFGYDALPYHAASLLMHLVNVCLVYVILCHLLEDCTDMSRERNYVISVTATLLFAIHPLQMEAVAWISASKILMSMTFYLLATYSFIRYLACGRRLYYVSTSFLYVCSYLSKENVMTFPLWAALLSVMYGQKLKKRQFWATNLPLIALTLLMSLHLVFKVAGYDEYVQGDVFPWWKRMLFCFYSLFNYLYYWLLPLRLDWMYPFPVGLHDSFPWWLFLYPVLLLVMVLAVWSQMKRRLVSCVLLFSLIHLLFVIHIIVLPREGVIADRYMYLPIVGMNVLLAFCLTGCHWVGIHRRIMAVLCAFVIVLLAVLTFSRTHDWHDSKMLKGEAACCMSNRGNQPVNLAVVSINKNKFYETTQVCCRCAGFCQPDSLELCPVREAVPA